jgi:hypothetical protein
MTPNCQVASIILLISPIILIQVGMAIYALIDLARRVKTRGPRWAWALGLIVTIFGVPSGIIVSGVYLAWGRHAEA